MSQDDRELELFEAAVQLPPEARAAFLERACAGAPELRAAVESLLAHDRPGLPVERPALGVPFAAIAPRRDAVPEPTPLPERIGRYRVQGVLGAGTMAVVYRAEQDQPRRTVALKLLRPGFATAETARRLANEAEALGRLRHPGIAQVYEASTVALGGIEQPFLAMELVEGEPLTRHAERRGYSVRRRVELLAAACDAVEYAHQHGVIHRDLKPEHIVVEEGTGEPRLRILDFGIARLTEHRAGTLPGDVVGTLAYMSPEQAAGSLDLDTRADVYALGAVGFELCSGRLPIDVRGAPVHVAVQRIQAEAPSRLRARGRRGDLERILAKALAKDRAHRYPSAGALAEDLRRFLAHQPVQARPPSAGYLLLRFARRRRALMASLCAVGLAGLALVAAMAHAFARERAANEHMSATVLALARGALARLEGLAGTSEVRRTLLTVVLPDLVALLEQRPDDPELLACHADALLHLANLAHDEARYQDAKAVRAQTLALREQVLRLRPDDLAARAARATDLVRLGDADRELAGAAAARPAYERAHVDFVALARAAPADVVRLDDLSWSWDRLAWVAIEERRFAEAETLLRERRAAWERVAAVAPRRPATLAGERAYWAMLAHLAIRRDDPRAALEPAARSVDAARRWLAVVPGRMDSLEAFAGSAAIHADLLGHYGDPGEARGLLAQAREVLERMAVLDPGSVRLVRLRDQFEAASGWLATLPR